MSEKSIFVYNNTYVRKISRLYLDSKTSDVNFVFNADTEHCEKVPAHKNILSIENPVFNAMLYGPVKKTSDIPIKDVSAAVFMEFLQFFYLDQVRLTAENIVHVMNLCKMYEMDECMKTCETILLKSLTIDDMCVGYSIALLLEQEKLVQFCEQQIKTNALDIIKSASFLESDRGLLEKIIILVSSNWSALETVVACMEWAKTKCSRKQLEQCPNTLRKQLQDIFNQIPFDKLTLVQFPQHVATYKGFFDGEEIGAINQKILLRNQQSKSFDLQLLQIDLPKATAQLDRPANMTILHDNRKEQRRLLLQHYLSRQKDGTKNISIRLD